MTQNKQTKKQQTLSDSELVKYLKGFKKVDLKHKTVDVESLIKIVDIIKAGDYTVKDIIEAKTDDNGDKILKSSTRVCSRFNNYKCIKKVEELFYNNDGYNCVTHNKRVVKKGLLWVGYVGEYETHVVGKTKKTKVILDCECIDITINCRDDSEDIYLYQDFYGELTGIEFIERVKTHIMNKLDIHKEIKLYNNKITALNKILKTL